MKINSYLYNFFEEMVRNKRNRGICEYDSSEPGYGTTTFDSQRLINFRICPYKQLATVLGV